MFIFTAILLFLILPGEPKFKYEYQKGFPWQHENLVAPFDFAILKTDKEIEDERIKQVQDVVPYFTYDTTKISAVQKLRASLEIDGNNSDPEKIAAFNSLETVLFSMYNNGILQRSADSYEVLNGKAEIKKRTGNKVNRIEIEKLNTPCPPL